MKYLYRWNEEGREVDWLVSSGRRLRWARLNRYAHV